MVVVEIVEGLLLCPNFSCKSALLLTHYKTGEKDRGRVGKAKSIFQGYRVKDRRWAAFKKEALEKHKEPVVPF